jgi:Flp pilus assembly protein TadG
VTQRERRRPVGSDDEGTVLLLIVGFTVVLLLVIAVVVDASAVILAKRGAASAADGAAVAAAQQSDAAAVRAGLHGQLPLDEQQVAAVVAVYETDTRTGQPGLRLRAAVEQGTTAVVEATRTVQLPFVGWLGVGQVQITAQARARSPVLP